MLKAEIETDPPSNCVVHDVPHHVPGLLAVQDVSDHIQQLGRVIQECCPGGGVDLVSAGQEDVTIVPCEGP